MTHPRIAAIPGGTQRDRLKALLSLAAEMQVKAAHLGADGLDESELDLVSELAPAILTAQGKVAGLDDTAAKLKGGDQGGVWTNLNGSDARPASVTPSGYRKNAAAGFAKAITDALSQGRPDGSGQVRKALVPGGLVGFDFGAPIEALPTAPLTVAGLCTIEDTLVPSGRLLQQTARTPNAQPTPIGATKPFTTATTVAKDWQVATIPTLVGPIPKQWLSDIADALPWLGQEAAWAVASALDTFILQGGTVEDGTTVYGMLNTSGINGQALVSSDPLLTIRTAIGKLQAAGVAPNGVLMNADQWTTLSTIKDSTGRYILDAAPADAVVQRLWGLPVVLSGGIPAGQAVVADFSTVQLKQREGYEAVIFESGLGSPNTGSGSTFVPGTDLATTNQVLLRAEGRWGVHLSSLPSITKVALA